MAVRLPCRRSRQIEWGGHLAPRFRADMAGRTEAGESGPPAIQSRRQDGFSHTDTNRHGNRLCRSGHAAASRARTCYSGGPAAAPFIAGPTAPPSPNTPMSTRSRSSILHPSSRSAARLDVAPRSAHHWNPSCSSWVSTAGQLASAFAKKSLGWALNLSMNSLL